ncbi:MAG: HD domain-containing protein [Desulfotomaculum sp.]|nr:HD domain-containing protein [Desulfotomaculum sp.]
MGRALKLPQERIADLCLFARFHNIGMVGISDITLFQEGRLTGEKCNIIKQHCEIGYNIAKTVPDLVHIADWILKHHEWWNGKGHPLGLKGKEIPLECRILSIVDAYNAFMNRTMPC